MNGVDLNINNEIYGLVGSSARKKHHLAIACWRVAAHTARSPSADMTFNKWNWRARDRLSLAKIFHASNRFDIRFFAEIRGLSSTEWLPRSMEILEFVGPINLLIVDNSGSMKQKLGWLLRL